MKTLFVTLTLTLLTSSAMSAQFDTTFVYELKLRLPFSHVSDWTEKEHAIQKAHVAYLDSLQQQGKIALGGIVDQGLEHHTGFVFLNVTAFEEAHHIAMEDPSVKTGMMTAHIRPVRIYFREHPAN